MLILALDTSGKIASAALCRDGVIVAEETRDGGFEHSRTILPVCEALLARCGASPRDVDVFAATAGPGSFTGLRIGTAAVKGLAWAQGKPCAAVSTLESAAQAACAAQGVLCALVHARTDEFFWALFRFEEGRLLRLTPDAVASAADIVRALPCEAVQLCGDGADLFLRAADNDARLLPGTAVQSAASTALRAHALALAGGLCSCHDCNPVYLRVTQAERQKAEQQNAEKEGKAI